MAASLLLVGMTGNGKSSTGNSILGRKAFSPSSSSQPCPEDIIIGSSVIDGKDIHVVDGPGIGDSDCNNPEDVEQTISLVKKALHLSLLGFNAVIIVFKYGVRFTKQEKDTVSMIKDILGVNVIKDYGVIVFTHGDTFNMDREEENRSFETWCQQQIGFIKDLFNKCENRYVLFNNRSKDDREQRDQRETLLAFVDRLQARSEPYTLEQYAKAKAGRNKIRVTSNLTRLEGETQRVVNDITDSLRELDVYRNPEWASVKVRELQMKLEGHKRRLQNEAKGTDVMRGLLIQVGILESNLKTKMDAATVSIQLLKQQEEGATHFAGDDETSLLHDHKEKKSCWSQCYQCIAYILLWIWHGIVYLGRRFLEWCRRICC